MSLTFSSPPFHCIRCRWFHTSAHLIDLVGPSIWVWSHKHTYINPPTHHTAGVMSHCVMSTWQRKQKQDELSQMRVLAGKCCAYSSSPLTCNAHAYKHLDKHPCETVSLPDYFMIPLFCELCHRECAIIITSCGFHQREGHWCSSGRNCSRHQREKKRKKRLWLDWKTPISFPAAFIPSECFFQQQTCHDSCHFSFWKVSWDGFFDANWCSINKTELNSVWPTKASLRAIQICIMANRNPFSCRKHWSAPSEELCVCVCVTDRWSKRQMDRAFITPH